MTRDCLANDIETLKDLVMAQFARAEAERARAEYLAQQLAYAKRALFGRSSEKLPAPPQGQEQFDFVDLPGEAKDAPAAETSSSHTESDAPATPAKKKSSGGRRRIPQELPRQRNEHTLPESERACECCGKPKQPFGEEISEQLEIVPAKLFVIQHVRIKYACPDALCLGKPTSAPPAQKLIDKGLAGPGLIADIIVGKYEDHQPLYRQALIFERHGFEIPRSTQCAWMGLAAELLQPIWSAMCADVKKSAVLWTDDTPVDVLDPGKGKTRTGRFWTYLGDSEHSQTVYDFTPNRKRDGPANFLKGFAGYLHADAYGGYDGIYAGGQVIEVACWAHARRKFFEALGTDRRAETVLRLVGELYDIERTIRDLLPPLRREVRQLKALPVLSRIEACLRQRQGDTPPKSPLGQAIGYALNQWVALTRYTEDGRLSIDNNASERALRVVALGRKNYLFMGNDRGGQRAAILYSLIATCKRHDVNTWDYLKDVLVRVSSHPASRIHELFPQNWKTLFAPATPASH